MGLKQLRHRQKNRVRNQNVHSATQKSQASKCDHPARRGMPRKMPGWEAHVANPQHLISSLGRALPFCLSLQRQKASCQLSWVSQASLGRTIWSPSLPSCLLSLLTAVPPLWGSKVICENGDLTKLRPYPQICRDSTEVSKRRAVSSARNMRWAFP